MGDVSIYILVLVGIGALLLGFAAFFKWSRKTRNIVSIAYLFILVMFALILPPSWVLDANSPESATTPTISVTFPPGYDENKATELSDTIAVIFANLRDSIE